MLFTTTRNKQKIQFLLFFCDQKKTQKTPNKIKEDLKKRWITPGINKEQLSICRNAISKLKSKTVALLAVKNNPPLLSICLHHQVFFQLESLAKDTFFVSTDF